MGTLCPSLPAIMRRVNASCAFSFIPALVFCIDFESAVKSATALRDAPLGFVAPDGIPSQLVLVPTLPTSFHLVDVRLDLNNLPQTGFAVYLAQYLRDPTTLANVRLCHLRCNLVTKIFMPMVTRVQDPNGKNALR